MLLDRCQDCYVLYLPAIIIMFLLRDLTKDMFAFDNIRDQSTVNKTPKIAKLYVLIDWINLNLNPNWKSLLRLI